MIEHNTLLVVLYWLAMIPIGMWILYFVTGYFTGEYPSSIRKGFLTLLLTVVGVYFTYDGSGYLFILMAQDPSIGIQLPQDYSYWKWLREPFALKWHVLNFAPIIRFLPVIIALCVGGMIQVFLLHVPYRIGAVVSLAQIILNLAAMVLLSIVFNQAAGFFDRDSSVEAKKPQNAREFSEPEGPPPPPESLNHLEHRARNLKPEQSSFWRRADAQRESVSRHLEPLHEFLQPVTQHLPVPVQDFLNGGAWLPVLVVLALLIVLWPRIHRKRKHHIHHRKHAKHDVAAHPEDKLALIGDAMTGLGARQATVRGMPARLRLVVLAATDSVGCVISNEMVPQALESLKQGLAEVVAMDVPRVEVWTDAHSADGFHQTFEKAAEVPEPKGQPSHWVLLVGQTSVGPGTVHVGLGLFTGDPTTFGLIEVAPGGWSESLDMRTVPVEDRG